MEPGQAPVAKKMNIWLVVSVALAISLASVLATNFISSANNNGKDIIKQDEASTILLDFINEVSGLQAGETTLKSITEEYGLYKVEVTTMDSMGLSYDQIIFMTRDGKFVFPQMIDIKDFLEGYREYQAQQVLLEQQAAAQNAEETDKVKENATE